MTFVVTCALLSSCRIYLPIFRKTKFLCIRAGQFHMGTRDDAKSTMELVSVPPVVSIYRQALKTFDVKFVNDLDGNLGKLKSMMDKLKPEDLGLDPELCNPETWRAANKAPCTYIEVFQNAQMNMSIFVLKPGFKMPLHDHPQMYGLLKVISGAVKVRSFTEYPVTQAVVNLMDIPTRAKYEAERLAKGFAENRKLFAEVSTNRICRDISGTCMLTPTHSNYHEIQALEMPAAFFDILAPPYDTLIEDIGPRRCRYYKVSNEISLNLVELQETEVPTCFYCDTAPYLGPNLC